MNARLPDELVQCGIKDMIEGEVGWTVPWAMYADYDGSLWLNGSYTLQENPGGTVEMMISKKYNQYIVDITHCLEWKWNKGTPGFVGDFEPIPVSELIK